MAPHTKTAPKARKPAREAARAQELGTDKAAEEVPTEMETFQPVKLSAGSTGLAIPEDRAQAIAAAHMAGMPIRQICQQFNCSHHTIAALIRNRPELLAAARDITANNWRTLAALGSASLLDRLPDMKDHALTVMSAIATEKAELLSGGATSRVEVIAAPAVDEWSDVVDGVVIESAPVPMGNASRTAAAKGKAAPAKVLPAYADGEQPLASDCSVTVDAAGVSVFEPVGAQFLPPAPPVGLGVEGVSRSSRTTIPDSLSDEKIFG